MEENALTRERRRKLEALIEKGVEPYGNRFDYELSLKDIVDSYDPDKEGAVVRSAGRIVTVRSHGKSVFFDVKDRTGRVQCYVKKNKVGEELFEVFSLLDLGDVIGFEGGLFRTKTGEITVFVDTFTVLAKAVAPLPEKWHGLKDVELRYRRRYLDLITNEKTLETFLARSAIIKRIRAFLDARGFIEVETPMMQAIPGGAAARPFVTHHNALGMKLFMRISPELYLKRLIVGGMEKVYEINRNFRNEGISKKHNPEFTMIELYQAFADYEVMMDLTEELLNHLAVETCGGETVQYGGHTLDFSRPFRRAEYYKLLEEHAGITAESGEDDLVAKAKELGVEVKDLNVNELTDAVFEAAVEPALVNPTFVIRQPSFTTPLCRPAKDNPALLDRFELFAVGGMELANAYSELNDPAEQKERFERQMYGRDEEDLKTVDYDYVEALEYGMPPAGGLGIGIDRLVMLLTDSATIRDVILFPLLRQADK